MPFAAFLAAFRGSALRGQGFPLREQFPQLLFHPHVLRAQLLDPGRVPGRVLQLARKDGQPFLQARDLLFQLLDPPLPGALGVGLSRSRPGARSRPPAFLGRSRPVRGAGGSLGFFGRPVLAVRPFENAQDGPGLVDLPDLGRQRIDQVAVVRDQQDRPA